MEDKMNNNLTNTEKRIYKLLVTTSMSNLEISDYLNVSLSTIKTHVKSICQKLLVKNRIELLLDFYNDNLETVGGVTTVITGDL
jgi:DNA-binding NarL/FixJ family response regulator